MLSQNTTHQAEALDRLPERNRDKLTLAALINACTSETQNVENALWQLVSERSIDTAVGEQLNVIGRVVGQDRATSTNDAEYRVLLKARVIANRSSGSVRDILAVFRALLGSLDGVELEPLFPASFLLHVLGETPVTDANAALFADFTNDAKAAGINAQFHYSTSPASLTFSCSPNAKVAEYFDLGIQTQLIVDNTEDFPASGFLLFDQGRDGLQMAVSYTSKTLNSFEGCSLAQGSVGARIAGDLVTGVGNIASQLKTDFEGPSFPSSIALYDASSFPDSGAVVLHYGLSTRRVFLYSSKIVNSLHGIVATSEGTNDVFAADDVIVFVDKGFSTTEEDTIGGFFSNLIETE